MRRPIRRALPVALVALPACARLGMPEPTTSEGNEVVSLWRLFFWAGAAVYALVGGLILVAVVRYRKRRSREAKPTRERVALEIAYTVAPVLLIAVLFVATIRTDRALSARAAAPDVVVDVTGFNWSWRFEYPAHGVALVGTPSRPPELVLPAPATVRFRLTSADIIHSFYVPAFLFKRDAVPGHVQTFDVRLEKTGTFRGVCAEFCGVLHAQMRFTVVAVPPDRFMPALQRAAEAVDAG